MSNLKMPTTQFFGHEISRLIIGDNPFNGWSYIPDTVTYDDMVDFYTEEKIIETLFEAEKLGITGMLPLGDPFILRTLRHYFKRGGIMKTIFQPYTAIELNINARMVGGLNAIGMYHQGSTTDVLAEAGNFDQIKENLKILRDTGMKVGLGTHYPYVIEKAEEEGWDVDFYVTCLHNARRGREGKKSGFITGESKAGIRFFPEDRPIMLDLVRKVDKPCVVFKIFAGGQIFYGRKPEEIPDVVRGVYREVFSAIKPGDIAAMGVFQRNKNELEENARIFCEVMAELGQDK